MAAGNFKMYEKGLLSLLDQTAGMTNLRAMLLDNAHTVDVVNDEFVADVVAEECADADYVSAGRQTVTGESVVITAGTIQFDCADITWGASVTIAARYMVLFQQITNDADSQLLFIVDLNDGGGANVSSSAGTFSVQINADGIYTIDVNP